MPATKKAGPKRVPLHEQKDKISVHFTEEAEKKYTGRWVVDTADGGSKIRRYLLAGYEFATPEDVVSIGDDLKFQSEMAKSTVIRVVANESLGDNKYLYLMKIPTEYFNEDQIVKQDQIAEHEQDLAKGTDKNNRPIEDSYGEIKIS